MENSKIEWTTHTFNPWQGCQRVSPGCQHCYAEEMMDRRYGKVKWGPQGTRVRTSDAYWRKPLAWNRKAAQEGTRYRVFCASLADVFEDRPELSDWRHDLWQLIVATPHLDWLLLTKRPENVLSRVPAPWTDTGWPAHVWVGTSVENQEYADKRIPHLLRVPAAVRFLSCEPLLGPVDLTEWLTPAGFAAEGLKLNATVDWVIVGGESGPYARPLHPQWVRDLRDQCQMAGVPFFFKQWGRWWPTPRNTPTANVRADSFEGQWFVPVGKHAAGKELDGETWSQVPSTS